MTKKPLNAAAIASELHEGSAYFRQAREHDTGGTALADPAQQAESVEQPAVQAPSQSTSRPASRPKSRLEQPANGATGARTARSAGTPGFDTSPVLGRPKSFYITAQQDKDLDLAVTKLTERLEGRGTQKIDRSTLMRLLLEVSDLTNEGTVDRLATQMVSRLVSQLTH